MLQKENRLLRVGVVGARVGEHHVSNCPHFLSCSASGGVASAVPIRGSVEKFEVSSSVQPSGTECEVTTPHLSFTIRQLFEGLEERLNLQPPPAIRGDACTGRGAPRFEQSAFRVLLRIC